MKKKLIFLLPAVLLSVAIFLLSSQASVVIPPMGIWNVDKLVHISAFIVYGICIQFAYFGLSEKKVKLNNFILTILISALFGGSDELHQYFVPGRLCDIYDFIADIIGAFVSIMLANFILKIANFINKRIIS